MNLQIAQNFVKVTPIIMQIDVNEVDLSEKEQWIYKLPLADLAAKNGPKLEKDAAFFSFT